MKNKELLICEWQKQIQRCDEIIARYRLNGFYDLIPNIERIKKEAETNLKQLKK